MDNVNVIQDGIFMIASYQNLYNNQCNLVIFLVQLLILLPQKQIQQLYIILANSEILNMINLYIIYRVLQQSIKPLSKLILLQLMLVKTFWILQFTCITDMLLMELYQKILFKKQLRLHSQTFGLLHSKLLGVSL